MTSPEPLDPDTARALEGLLRWYVAMGADGATGEEPHDRFAEASAAAPAPRDRVKAEDGEPAAAAPKERPARLIPALPDDAPRHDAAPGAAARIAEAEALAARAMSLQDLHDIWAGYRGCALAATASRMILSGGTPGARVMILGAAPYSDDERQGTAFAGAAGQLLDGMLAAIGLSRDTVYLAHVIPWRPPGNRAPAPLETALCLPFARRHIALARPDLILCLGERPAQMMLGTKESLPRLRGRWLDYEDGERRIKTAVTFSLDYLLSQPLQKKRAWIDLLAFAKTLETMAAPISPAERIG
jgi:DNA polymerase